MRKISFWKFYLIRKKAAAKQAKQNQLFVHPLPNNVKYAYSRTHSHTSKQNISFQQPKKKLRWQSKRPEEALQKAVQVEAKREEREKKKKKSNIIQLARKRILQFWCVEFKYKCTHRNAPKALLFSYNHMHKP